MAAMGVLSAACSDGPAQPESTPAQIHVVSRPATTDTALAILDDSVVLEISNGRGTMAGVRFLLQGDLEFLPEHASRERLFVIDGRNGMWAHGAYFTTDAQGRIVAKVRLGYAAGPAHLVIRNDSLGVADSIAFVVVPGKPASINLLPADTAVLAGRSWTMSAHAYDRNGNETTDALQITSASSALSIDAQHTVTSVGVGRGRIVVRAGSLADTAFVSVVPLARLASTRGDRVFLFNSDGSDSRSIQLASTYSSADAAWSASGEVIISRAEPAQYPHLFGVDTTSGTMRQILSGVPGVAAEYAPTTSADRQLIYFLNDNGRGMYEWWRVRPNGTNAAQLYPYGFTYLLDTRLSPSPDQTKAVFSAGGLRILDLQTGADALLRSSGWRPEWSPTGEWIAFYEDDGLHLIRPDGTEDHRIAPGDRINLPHETWSPDGKWIVAFVNNLALINIATGEILRLPFTANMTLGSVAWR